jgi:hypothetical protein
MRNYLKPVTMKEGTNCGDNNSESVCSSDNRSSKKFLVVTDSIPREDG